MKYQQKEEKISLGGNLEKELEENSSLSSTNYIGEPPTKNYTNNQGLPWLKSTAAITKINNNGLSSTSSIIGETKGQGGAKEGFSSTYTSPSYLLTPNIAIQQQPFSPQTSPRYSKDSSNHSHRQYSSASATATLIHSMSQEQQLFNDELIQDNPTLFSSSAQLSNSPRPHPPSSPSPSSKQYSAIINTNQKNKNLKFVPYKSTHPDLLEKITLIVSNGMKEIEKIFEEDQHNQNQKLLKKLQDKKLKKMKKKLEKLNNNNNNDNSNNNNEDNTGGEEDDSDDELKQFQQQLKKRHHEETNEVKKIEIEDPKKSETDHQSSESNLTGLEEGGSVYIEDQDENQKNLNNFSSDKDKINYLNNILKNNLTSSQGPTTAPFNTTKEIFELDDSFTFTSPNNLYSFHKLKLYDYAFETYIDSSSIYQPFLKDVRDSYWNHINKISSYFTSYEDNFNRIKRREEALEREILKVKHESSTKISELRRQINLLEFNIEQANEKRIQAEKIAKEAKDSENLIKKSYDDLKKSCVTITSSLSRMEEEHRKYVSTESIRLTEIVHLRAQEQKLNEEIERLQQLNQHHEQVQATMLSAEAAAALDLKFDTMQKEMLKMEKIHRQLIIRYSNLKSVVEDCIVKWSTSTSTSNTSLTLPQFNNYIRDQVQIRLQSIKERNQSELNQNQESNQDSEHISSDISLLDSFQKTISKNDIDPTIIISTLLDRIDNSSRFSSSTSSSSAYSMKQFTSNARPLILGGDIKQNQNLSSMFSTENIDSTSLTPSDNFNKQEQFYSPWNHFDGYGYQEFIPKYLKFHGKIHNFYLTKKEIVLLIKEIWLAYSTYLSCLEYKGKSTQTFFNNTREELIEIHRQIQNMSSESYMKLFHLVPKNQLTSRSLGDESNKDKDDEAILTHELFLALPPSPSLSTFAITYFKEKLRKILKNQINSTNLNSLHVNNLILPTSSISTPVIELCYNFLDGIKRFYSYSDCKLFSYVFRDKLSHDVYIDQVNLIENLRSEVEKEVLVSKTSNFGVEDANGDLKLDQFLRLLRRLYPNKSEHSLNKLSKALLLDNQTGRYIKTSVVLAETSDGRTSNFLEQLKIQHINEIIGFEKHLIDVLEQFAENFNSENGEINQNEDISESYYDTKQKTSKTQIKSKLEASIEETIYNEENVANSDENAAENSQDGQIDAAIPLNNFPLLDFDSTFSSSSRSSNAQKLNMTVGQLREALCHADTNKSREEINLLLSRGCACDLENLLLMEAKRVPVRLGPFIARIRKGILKKSLPQPSKAK